MYLQLNSFLPVFALDDGWSPLYNPKSTVSAPALPVLNLTTPKERWQGFHFIFEEETGVPKGQMLSLWSHSKYWSPPELLQSLLPFQYCHLCFLLNVVIEDKFDLAVIQLPLPLPPRLSKIFLRALLHLGSWSCLQAYSG